MELKRRTEEKAVRRFILFGETRSEGDRHTGSPRLGCTLLSGLKMKKSEKEPSAIIFHVFVCVALFVGMVLLFYVESHKPVLANVCPIDGQVAEWSRRQGRNDCEYGHFSVVEKTTHSWSGRCP